MHLQALYSADVILPGSSSKLRIFSYKFNFSSVDSWLIRQLHKASNVVYNSMQNPVLIYNTDELVIRNRNYQYLISALIFTVLILWLIAGPYDKSRVIFKENLMAAIILTIALVIGTFYCWFKLFDRSIKIIVNKKGIWTKKLGLILWDSIQYYYFGLLEGEITIYLLNIKLHNSENELQIDISYANNARNDLAQAILQYSIGHNIFNLSEDQYK